MKFPAKRKSKHYFPVNARDPLLQQFQPENETSAAWVVGIDQTLVDIEAKVDDEFIERYGLSAGHSLVIEDDVAEALYQELKQKNLITHQFADPLLQQFQPENETSAAWVVGIDQTLVDIEAKVDDEFIERYGLSAGHSLVIEDDVAEALYQELKQKNLITHQFAGGTIGNTMHNYSVLADDRSVLFSKSSQKTKPAPPR